MEVANAIELGRSLQVPSVQEIAKEKMAPIPSRYVRFDKKCLVSDSNSLQVPVIDMNMLRDGELINTHELKKLHQACKEWGFFQVIVIFFKNII